MTALIIGSTLVLLFFGKWGFNILRHDLLHPRFPTVLIVNVDSQERDYAEDGVPTLRTQLRLHMALPSPLVAGMRLSDEFGFRERSVVSVVVSPTVTGAYLEPLVVPRAQVAGAVEDLKAHGWKVALVA